MKIRTIRNRYGDANAACDAWLAGSLWGNPIRLGPQKLHVYGAWRRRLWKMVSVEFTRERITVVR